MNALFLRMAERVTYLAGTWQHMAVWTAALVAWIALGPSMSFSNTWQLLANTPTTLIELYLGLFILIAESHSKAAEEHIKEMQLKHNANMEVLMAGLETLLLRVEGEVEEIEDGLHT